ncbi:MAG: hypothetical protein KR126chlam6_00577 [Candidatus Anoxychlamydiales bacterium]|nr:hypothetical protein [Candidatus Anoxychlamydiales bacterium]
MGIARNCLIVIYKKKLKENTIFFIGNINILSSELISFSLTSHDVPYLGYVYINDDKAMQKVFFGSIQKSLA